MAEEKTYVFGNDANSLPLAYALNGNNGWGNGLGGWGGQAMFPVAKRFLCIHCRIRLKGGI